MLEQQTKKQNNELVVNQLNERKAQIDDNIIRVASQIRHLRIPFTRRFALFFKKKRDVLHVLDAAQFSPWRMQHHEIQDDNLYISFIQHIEAKQSKSVHVKSEDGQFFHRELSITLVFILESPETN